MTYSEYRDLTPIDNIENGDKYIEALEWAFHNKRIKNIALTGPYGAGKSSIIETFLAKNEKNKSQNCICPHIASIRKSALKISMATFFKGYSAEKDESDVKINIDSDEVEKGILKQLFYKVEPCKIPQSRYRKLHPIKFIPAFLHVIVGLLFIMLLVDIFVKEKFDGFIQAVNDFLPIANHSPVFSFISVAILLLIFSTGIAYLYLTVISRFRIKEIKFPTDTTVQSGSEEPDSVFNKNLDEIVYFFESSGYRTVFFEDLDRLDDPKIFVHLRELNNLLNNDDSIKSKPIVFVYAVRDDIFSKEDRTKFFDFIIPVIPVINSTNSGEILLQRLQEAKNNGIEHNISQGFILDVAPFVSDMRILLNIYNEFVIYKETLRTSQKLSLSDEQMFAMIIFKNLYPSDFADIQDEKGILKKAFEDKQQFVGSKKASVQEKIDAFETTITKANNDIAKSVRELKYAMFGTFMNGTGQFQGFCTYNGCSPSISAQTILYEEFDMTELLNQDYRAIQYLNRYDAQYASCDSDQISAFVERWKVIKDLKEKGLENLQKELQEFHNQQHIISGMSIKLILSISLYTFFSRMFDLMQHPVMIDNTFVS